MQKPDPNGNCFGISCHRFWQNVCTYICNSGVDGRLKTLTTQSNSHNQLAINCLFLSNSTGITLDDLILAVTCTQLIWSLVNFRDQNFCSPNPTRTLRVEPEPNLNFCITTTSLHDMYKIAIVPECPIRLWFEFWCIHTLAC